MLRVTLPHLDLIADHQQEILEIVRQARAASPEENVNHITAKDLVIVRIHLVHHVQKVANVGHTTAKDLAIVRIRLVHHVQKVVNTDHITAKDLAIVRTRLAHHVQKVANVVHITVKDLAIVRTRLAHRAKKANVVRIMENHLHHAHLVKILMGAKIRQSLTVAMAVILSLVLSVKNAQALSLERSVVRLHHAKRVAAKRNFHNVRRLRVEIAMMRRLPLPHNIN